MGTVDLFKKPDIQLRGGGGLELFMFAGTGLLAHKEDVPALPDLSPLSFKAYKLQQLSYSVLKNNVRFSIIENLHIIPCFLILGKRRCYGDRGQ